MSREIITISKMGSGHRTDSPSVDDPVRDSRPVRGILQYPQDDTGNLQEQRVERN